MALKRRLDGGKKAAGRAAAERPSKTNSSSVEDTMRRKLDQILVVSVARLQSLFFLFFYFCTLEFNSLLLTFQQGIFKK